MADGDDRALAESEFAHHCNLALQSLMKVMKHEDNHIMQHTLQSLKGELKWAVREFAGGSAHAK